MGYKLVFALIIFLSLAGISSGDSITGFTTYQNTNVSVYVTPTFPLLTLIRPVNGTYLRNESIFLNYTAELFYFVWYNLDYGNNLTITSPIYFNATEGFHTLYLYANNSDGTTARNITFYVNKTRFTIIYSDWQGGYKGNSTDFLFYTYEELQNLGNIILEYSQFSKILFLEPINVTNDISPSDDYVNLNLYVNTSYNHAEVNTTGLPNFNKPATIWLYNLTFNSPRILKDGQPCPSTVCTKESYSSGVLKFNVTGFTVYSAEETPSVLEKISVRKGITPLTNFTIDKTSIKVSLFPGETTEEQIKITNTGRSNLEIKLNAGRLNKLITFSENPVVLKPGEIKTISISIKATNELPFVYIGSITLESGKLKKELPLIIKIKSRDGLLSISANIVNKELHTGEELKVNISISKDPRLEQNLVAYYIITNKDNKTVLTEKENLAIYDSIDFIKKLKIPLETPGGKYILYVQISQDNIKAEDADVFYVIEIEKPLLKNYIYLILLLIVIALIILIIIKKKRKEQNIEKGEIEKRIRRKPIH